MSAHRAPRRARSATRAETARTTHDQPQRSRRRPDRTSRRPLPAIGGIAAASAAAVFVTVGQGAADADAPARQSVAPTPTPSSASAPTNRAHDERDSGPTVTARSSDANDEVTRSFQRSGAAPVDGLTVRAEQAASARLRLLTKTSVSAEDMSQQIKKERARQRRLARQRAIREAHEWDLPTSGFHISTWFGTAGPYWESGYHTGIDFASPCGTPVVAVADGTISEAGSGVGGWAYGNQVRLQLSNGDEVWYNHLSSISASTGESVAKGQVLGTVGDTGNAYGCHLHFEYRLASDLETGVDPLPYLEDNGIHLR